MNFLSILSRAIAVAILVSFAAHAEHEANHRYNVRGYVLDAENRPVADAPVSIRMGEDLVGSARTDSDGYYSIRAHLHDSDLGRTLSVRAGEDRVEIRMQGTPRDLATERIHYVNVVGGELVERELDRGGLPRWSYAAGGLLLASAGIVAAQRWRRRSRRLKRREEAAVNPKRRRKKKRKRRRR